MPDRPAAPAARPARVTLRDVAERAGVSASTASLVVRDSPLIARDTRGRVLEAMQALGYVYNRAASALRSQPSQTIGVLVGEITNPFYAAFTGGVDAVLDGAGRLPFLANSGESPERQERFIRRIREQGVEGMLFVPAPGTPPSLVEGLRASGLPCIQAMRYCGPAPRDYVGPDYRLGMTLATEHLIARGHRRIAYLGAARETSALSERLAGFSAAMARHGLSPAALTRCPATRREGDAMARALMARAEPPTAFLCYNDVLALGVLAGLHRMGLAPGPALSVIGFDDIAEAADGWIGLSSVAIDPDALGRAAADLLLARIANPNGPPEQVILPPRLIIRET